MTVIAVIGAGGIGSRHLQALALLEAPATVWAIDPSEASRATATTRWEEVEGHERHEFRTGADASALPDAVDVAVIATTAKVRLSALEGLLERSRVRHLVLEKFLFQREGDYAEALDLVQRSGATAWVNCPRRVWPAWIEARTWFEGTGPLSCRVLASKNNPLGSNAIHWLDLAAWLRPGQRFELDASGLTLLTGDSRHAGHAEFGGVLIGRAPGAIFEYTRHETGGAPMLAHIESPGARLILREAEQIAWVSTERNGWAWEQVEFPLTFQSRLTNEVVRDLLESGRCGLATLEESTELHRDMLGVLLACYRAGSGEETDACPIT